jgi:hypothetical protein
MGPIYRDDKQVRIICREIMSLNLMPAEKITKRFESIVKEIDRWSPPIYWSVTYPPGGRLRQTPNCMKIL